MKHEECSHEECQGTLRQRLMDHLVGMVPKESAICEFDCSRTECSNEEWTHCKRRLASLEPAEAAQG